MREIGNFDNKVNPEQHRLEELYSYKILDTPPEESWNEVVQMACIVCDTPVAIVSFMDEKRQWFKARKGTRMTEIARKHAFYEHHLGKGDGGILVIENLHADKGFKNNPYVKGLNQINFYAAVPLISSNGNILGTLSVMDQQSRTISEDQKQVLCLLAGRIMMQLEARKVLMDLEQIRNDAADINTTLESEPKKSDPTVVYYNTVQSASEQQEYFVILEKILFDISHTMRGPVASLLGLTALIEKSHTDEKMLKDYMGHIKDISIEMDDCLRKMSASYHQIKDNLIAGQESMDNLPQYLVVSKRA